MGFDNDQDTGDGRLDLILQFLLLRRLSQFDWPVQSIELFNSLFKTRSSKQLPGWLSKGTRERALANLTGLGFVDSVQLSGQGACTPHGYRITTQGRDARARIAHELLRTPAFWLHARPWPYLMMEVQDEIGADDIDASILALETYRQHWWDWFSLGSQLVATFRTQNNEGEIEFAVEGCHQAHLAAVKAITRELDATIDELRARRSERESEQIRNGTSYEQGHHRTLRGDKGLRSGIHTGHRDQEPEPDDPAGADVRDHWPERIRQKHGDASRRRIG